MSEAPEQTGFDLRLLWAVNDVGCAYPVSKYGFALSPQESGWVTSASVREHIDESSLTTRKGLKHLVVEGYLENETFERVDFFRLSALGERAIEFGTTSIEPIQVNAMDWTGVVEPVQIQQVLRIVSEIEDVAESITDNVTRSQILGLVRVLNILLDLPQPPRQGIIDLVRDPAFANIIQIGTLIAAIIAALKP